MVGPQELAVAALNVGWPVLLLFAAAGYGGLAHRLSRPAAPAPDLFLAAIVGLVLIAFAAAALNLFRGLGDAPGPLTVGLGLLAYLPALRRAEWRAQSLVLLTAIAGTAFLFDGLRLLLFGRSMTFSFDAGLYHVQHLEWIALEPAPFGLANLSGRLGFTSAWLFVVSALRWDEAFGWRHVFHAELAIRALAFAWLLWRLLDAWRERRAGALRLYGAALLALGWCSGAMGFQTSLDHAANLCVLLAWVAWCELAADPRRPAASTWLALFALSALALAIKISVLPVVLLPVLALAHPVTRPARAELRPLLPLLGLLLAFALAMAAHGIVASGCVAYPAVASCVRVPWGVPLEDVRLMAATITGWARQPDAGYLEHARLGYFGWLAVWLPKFVRSAPFLVLCAGALAWLLARLLWQRRGGAAPSEPDGVGTALVAVVGIAFWFLAAPDPRFGWGFFAITCAALLRPGLALVPWPDPDRATLRLAARVPRWRAFLLVGSLLLLASLRWPPVHPPTADGARVAARNGVPIVHPRGQQCWALRLCSPDPVADVSASQRLGRSAFEHARAAD